MQNTCDYTRTANLASLMFARARAWSEKPLFRTWQDDGWQDTSWEAYARAGASAARAFLAMGIGTGDRVVFVSESRLEVPVAELGLMAIGAVPVPVYTTNTPADHAHVLRDCTPRAVIASSDALVDRIRQAGWQGMLIAMDAPGPDDIPFASLLDSADRDYADIEQRAASIPEDQLACLIYTSGTGGAPKGVMLPHRCMLANCRAASQVLRPLKLGHDDVYLSFLPLSHAFEHTIGLYFLGSMGVTITYARGLETLAGDMHVIRPTIMLVVPRFLALLRARILAQVAKQPRWKQALFHRATRPPRGLDVLISPLLDRLVRRKLRDRFGGRFRAMMSGGAPLDPALGLFFQSLGIQTMQGYGETEAGPVISCTAPEAVDLETVGAPFPGTELRIAEDGEICVRGAMVMDGYWQNPTDTATVLRDGWLYTGDIGALDARGNLRITDRKKDLIVLSGGDKIYPAKIEALLMAQPEIAQAVVAGEGEVGLAALIVPADDHSPADAAAAIARVNPGLSVTERVRRHTVVPPFTIENGLLTPTQKIRRHLAIRTYADALVPPASGAPKPAMHATAHAETGHRQS